jgi:transmembrane sensor
LEEGLLKRFLKGDASPEEAQAVLKWIKSKVAPEDINRLFDNYNSFGASDKTDAEAILQKIHHLINIEELMGSLDDQYKRPDHHPSLSDRGPIRGKNTRTMKRLWQTAIPILFILLAGIFLLPKYLEKSEPMEVREVVYLKKSTERGQKLNIQLSDGSRVTLNSASSILFEENFNDSIRLIALEGEAFFDVTSDNSRPFTVVTGDIQTIALGTSFNIEYRPENKDNKVSLVNGKVTVGFIDSRDEPLVLESGEMADLDFDQNVLAQKNFDLEQVTAWRSGIIFFRDAGLGEVIHTLENWYGVNISMIGRPKEGWKFSARFENESLRNVLDALQYAQGLNYILKDKKVTIEFQGK